MRLRHDPRALDELLKHQDIVIFKPQLYKGKWRNFFENTNTLEIELGMGRGRFITTHAELNPSINYIGIELRNEVIQCALEKVLDKRLENIALIPLNIATIDEGFEAGEVDKIYLNFSDPWPKARHAKRRLTHRNFLLKYKEILKDDGEIILKTDSLELFDFSLAEFMECGFDVYEVTNDLAALKDEHNIATEYELKFTRKNMLINRLKAKKR